MSLNENIYHKKGGKTLQTLKKIKNQAQDAELAGIVVWKFLFSKAAHIFVSRKIGKIGVAIIEAIRGLAAYAARQELKCLPLILGCIM